MSMSTMRPLLFAIFVVFASAKCAHDSSRVRGIISFIETLQAPPVPALRQAIGSRTPPVNLKAQTSVTLSAGPFEDIIPELTLPEDERKDLERQSIAGIQEILSHPDVELPKIDSDADIKEFKVPVKCNFGAFQKAQKYLKALKSAKTNLLEATENVQKGFAAELVLDNDYHINHPCNQKMIDDYILGLEAIQALNMKITNTNFLVVGIVGACASINAALEGNEADHVNAVDQTNKAWAANNNANNNNGVYPDPYGAPDTREDPPMTPEDTNDPNLDPNSDPLNLAGSNLPSNPNSFGGAQNALEVSASSVYMDPAGAFAIVNQQ